MFALDLNVSVVYCDNQGAIKIAHSLSSSGRTKHLDIRLQFIKQMISKGKVKVEYVPGTSNIADIFTKPLGRVNFKKLSEWLLSDNTRLQGGVLRIVGESGEDIVSTKNKLSNVELSDNLDT